MASYRQQWVLHFDLPPERLWPAFADTARLNEAAGLPTYVLQETAEPDGTVHRRTEARIAGMAMAWEEHPYEWVRDNVLRQSRSFSKGPMRSVGIELLLDREASGTRVTLALWGEPANLLGRVAGPFVVRVMGRNYVRLARQAVDFLKGSRATVFDYTPPSPPPGAGRRLELALAALARSPYTHGLERRLADHVTNAQDVDVSRIRPLALAREWRVQPRHAVELCLAAVDAGLLGMRWDLLCPSCRGGKGTVATLDQLPTGVHCPSCNIDYSRDFARNVELAFFPSAAIRPIPDGGYCLSGPMTTPHVLAQQILAPGETRSIDLNLGRGHYRARGLTGPEAAEFEHEAGKASPLVIATATGIELGLNPTPGVLTFVNRRQREATLVLESRDWVADALTAHQATTLQAFRDLFSDATLRPGDEAGVDQVTLMFSDLKGSTALYERVGDAAAYNLVREHFAFLGGIVRDNNGAIVKTIGDAVMAAFGDPADAVRAAIDIQGRVGEFNDRHRSAGGASEAIVVKLGIHRGATVVVNLNGRLDYFGSTVNLAARMQGESRGADIVVSAEITADPAVAPILHDLPYSREAAALRGFARAVPFCRVVPASKTPGPNPSPAPTGGSQLR